MRAWWFLVMAGAVSCSADPVEGSNAGDCEDQADNDADGFFDCDDNGCWGAPTCTGSGTHDTDPGDTDDGGGGQHTDEPVDTDLVVTGDGVNARLKSVAITYRLDVSWDQAGEVICNSYFDVNTPEEAGPDTFCDCTAIFQGKGHLEDVLETRNRYVGTWERVSTNCAKAPESVGSIASGMTIDESSVYVPPDGNAFHTFRFNSSGAQSSMWVAHEDAEADQPCEFYETCPGTAVENGHFWIVFGRAERVEAGDPTLDETSLRLFDPVLHDGKKNWYYTENGQFLIPSQGITMNLHHQFAATFSESFSEPEYPEFVQE